MAAEEGSGALPSPRPRSPPRYPDLCGRHRLQAEFQLLSREISFLEEELQSVEGLQPVSACCKEYVSILHKSDLRRETNTAAFGGGFEQWFAATQQGRAAPVITRAGGKDQVAPVNRIGPAPHVVHAHREIAARFPAPDYSVPSQLSHVLDIPVDVFALAPLEEKCAFALDVCVVSADEYLKFIFVTIRLDSNVIFYSQARSGLKANTMSRSSLILYSSPGQLLTTFIYMKLVIWSTAIDVKKEEGMAGLVALLGGGLK
ncbi:hypothetical protein MUK42_15879 [Musa troglodytarum]|uniref:G protein gamma domain-containing protein n=1 Tax=Musa troglodytarum TaxID=320322 RepID=A0A9E7KQ04_9LILI|nr:hypothetical protein MUK42_15879 [Musa troglodytarum]